MPFPFLSGFSEPLAVNHWGINVHWIFSCGKRTMSKGVPPQNPRQALKAVSYFAGLVASALVLVERAVIRRMYEPGQIVFIAGEPSSGLYVIEEGWLKVVKTSLDGREQTLQTLGPEDVFNALSVFTGVPNQATVEALEKSTLWLMPREAMLRLLDENPCMAQAVIQDLAGRVQHLISLVEDLSLRSVEARLARRSARRAVFPEDVPGQGSQGRMGCAFTAYPWTNFCRH